MILQDQCRLFLFRSCRRSSARQSPSTNPGYLGTCHLNIYIAIIYSGLFTRNVLAGFEIGK